MANIIKTAEKYKGYGPDRFTSAYGVPSSTAWCCIFVWYIFRECNASKLFYNGQKTAYCPNAYVWCRANLPRVSVGDAKAGDIIFFDWNGNGDPDHIGFVKAPRDSSSVVTIEGNTDGNRVAEQIREKFILGIFRPKYTSGSSTGIVTINRKMRVVNPNGADMRRGASRRYRKTGHFKYGQVILVKKMFKDKNGEVWYWTSSGATGWVPLKLGKTIYLHSM